MKRSCIYFQCILFFFLLTSCELMQFNENQIVIKKSNVKLNEKNILKIQETCSEKDTLKFVVTGDNQGFYDALEDFVDKVNSMDVDFVMICGDLTNYGIEREFELAHDELKKLKCPYVAVLGNHDMVANGERVYAEMYGEANFSFVVGNNKFIGLNTNSREYNFDGRVPNLSWLEKQLETTCENVFIFGHVPPWSGDYDAKLEIPFVNVIKKRNKVTTCFFGHDHSFYSTSYYAESQNDDTPYLIVGSTGRKSAAYSKVWSKKQMKNERFDF